MTMQNTQDQGKRLQDMITAAESAIRDYEAAQRELASMDLGGGYVLGCQNTYLTFDIDPAGYVCNPQPCRPHLARSFSKEQAEELATAIVNGDGHQGAAMHVGAAVAAALDDERGVLELLTTIQSEALASSINCALV